MLANEHGSHAHARSDAHARHKYSLVYLLCDVQTCGNLACTSCSEGKMIRSLTHIKRGGETYSCQEGVQWRSHHR